MNAKMLAILAFSGLVAFGAINAQAADGRDTSLDVTKPYQETVIEGRNVAVDLNSQLNEGAAIRNQVEGNARSTH